MASEARVNAFQHAYDIAKSRFQAAIEEIGADMTYLYGHRLDPNNWQQIYLSPSDAGRIIRARQLRIEQVVLSEALGHVLLEDDRW